MTYEQRVEAYGDVCLKFATLLENDVGKLEQLVATVLMHDVPKSEEPLRYYLQQIYVPNKPAVGGWLFKQSKKSKRQQPIVASKMKSRKTNAWIMELQQLKVPERAALFATHYLQLADGAVSELLQTPIDAVRGFVKTGAKKLEGILEKHNLAYINETNFKKYFDEDFGSTYNARRRLKQMQVVATLQKHKPKKVKRPVPNWIPLVLAGLIFFSTMTIPFAYHQSKKLPLVDEQVIEASLILNSLSQPYFMTIHDNYRNYLDYIVTTSAAYTYIKKQNIYQEVIEESVLKMRTQYEDYQEMIRPADAAIHSLILSEFGLTLDDYYTEESEYSALYMYAYEQLSPMQITEMHDYQQTFFTERRADIDLLMERYEKYNGTEALSACTLLKYTFKADEDMEIAAEETHFCILPNNHVAYTYLGNFYSYFHQVIMELEEELAMSYNPFSYHKFYKYLSEKSDVTKKEQELLQMTQVLAYTYELVYPGWIEPVPPLKSEGLIFSN